MLLKSSCVFHVAILLASIFHVGHLTTTEKSISESEGYGKEYDKSQKSVIVETEFAPAAITNPDDLEWSHDGYFVDDRIRNAPPGFHSFLNYENYPASKQHSRSVKQNPPRPTTTPYPSKQKKNVTPTARQRRNEGQPTALYHPVNETTAKPKQNSTLGGDNDVKPKSRDAMAEDQKARDEKLEFMKLIDRVGFEDALKVFQERRSKQSNSTLSSRGNSTNSNVTITSSHDVGKGDQNNASSHANSTEPPNLQSTSVTKRPRNNSIQMGRVFEDVDIPTPDPIELTTLASSNGLNDSNGDTHPLENQNDTANSHADVGDNSVTQPTSQNVSTDHTTNLISDHQPTTMIPQVSTEKGHHDSDQQPTLATTSSPPLKPSSEQTLSPHNNNPSDNVKDELVMTGSNTNPGSTTLPTSSSSPKQNHDHGLQPAAYLKDANELLEHPNGSYVRDMRVYYLNPKTNDSNTTTETEKNQNSDARSGTDLNSSNNTKSELSCPSFQEFIDGSKEFWGSLMDTSGVTSGIEVLMKALLHAMKVLGGCFYKVSSDLLSFVSTMFSFGSATST